MACWLRGVGVSVAVIARLAAPAPLSAVTFTVDDNSDVVDANLGDGLCVAVGGSCTLRAAVMQANVAGGAGATIVLPAGTYFLAIPVLGNDGDHEGDLNLKTPANGDPLIQILGAGATTTIIDPGGLSRAFLVETLRSASIAGVTIRNGGAFDLIGGAIRNAGSLAVSDSVLSGNKASYGGAIESSGSLTLDDTLLHSNEAAVSGGAIDQNGGSLTITDSEVSGNAALTDNGGGVAMEIAAVVIDRTTIGGNRSAKWAGGLYVYGGTLVVRNSTLSGNHADSHGGGMLVWVGATASIYSSSILFNEADADADVSGGSGAGIYNAGGTVNVLNTLVAGNYLAGFPEYDDCIGTIGSYGTNLFTSAASICNIVVHNGNTGYLNSLNSVGVLQNNGGPTRTHALLAGSNAIDGTLAAYGCVDGSSQLLPTDQRGRQRVLGQRCDVGAFEFEGIFSDGFESGGMAAWLPPPCLGVGESCESFSSNCCPSTICWNTEAGATGFQCVPI